jgi:hypothetical protein
MTTAVFPETKGVPLEEMDEIFQDAGMKQEDEEERAPLRMSAEQRAATEPPRLNEDEESEGGFLNRVFRSNSPRNEADRGRNGSAAGPAMDRGASNDRNYRSISQ